MSQPFPQSTRHRRALLLLLFVVVSCGSTEVDPDARVLIEETIAEVFPGFEYEIGTVAVPCDPIGGNYARLQATLDTGATEPDVSQTVLEYWSSRSDVEVVDEHVRTVMAEYEGALVKMSQSRYSGEVTLWSDAAKCAEGSIPGDG